MEDEDGVEAPHPSHPAKELWPYWPGGLPAFARTIDSLQDQWDIDLTDSTKECDTGAAAASPELLSSCVERCHAEVLQRLDKQDEVLRRIHITLLKQPTARALNTDINCKLPEMHDSGEFGQLDITNSLILGEEKVKVCTPEVFHTFTEADLVLRERAAEVDGDLSRQLYASAASTQGTLDRTRKERLQLWFRNLVNSPAFDMFFAFVVLTNSVFLGIEVELGMHTDEQPFALEVVQLIYAGLFTAELAMRVGAFGLGYFCGSDWMWAWLDFGIVLISLVEIFVDFLDKVRTGGEVDSNAVGSFTGFKALRLIRITRLLKTLRVVRIFRFVMALRTLVTSIVYTLRSLFWALTLLLLIVYVFSVLITQAVDPYLRENPLVSLPDEELEMARAHLNSLTQTMLSLFMSISGGLNWVDLAGPLQAISTF
ncbi:Sodium channel protein type 5 subunit alpha (Sodium channel protein cardiac muscle subunit alpha) (Sodium channel protein type V subunit alpha) (Voltage-gated sodium channel subunit alpha Nav1.5) (hH1) [Durusdinium trenchii]|uniref:Ion transport domain-containing protein n=1 Tax=Durusdinium trenchii TaxID=1381693 RepID=A0ABP0KA74_9DINO